MCTYWKWRKSQTSFDIVACETLCPFFISLVLWELFNTVLLPIFLLLWPSINVTVVCEFEVYLTPWAFGSLKGCWDNFCLLSVVLEYPDSLMCNQQPLFLSVHLFFCIYRITGVCRSVLLMSATLMPENCVFVQCKVIQSVFYWHSSHVDSRE